MGEILKSVTAKLLNRIEPTVMTSTRPPITRPLIIGCNNNHPDYNYAKYHLGNNHHGFIITGVDDDKARINGLLATSQPIKQRNCNNVITVMIDGDNKYFSFLSISLKDFLPLVISQVPQNSSIDHKLKQKQLLEISKFYGSQDNIIIFYFEPCFSNQYFDNLLIKKLIDKKIHVTKYLNSNNLSNLQVEITNGLYVYQLPHIITSASIDSFINPLITETLINVESDQLAILISLSDLVKGQLLEDVDTFCIYFIRENKFDVEKFLHDQTGLRDLTKERLFKKAYNQGLVTRYVFINKDISNNDIKIQDLKFNKNIKLLEDVPESE